MTWVEDSINEQIDFLSAMNMHPRRIAIGGRAFGLIVADLMRLPGHNCHSPSDYCDIPFWKDPDPANQWVVRVDP
jgi:hypothetical protein